jgi:probable HAF family extracellular repeat protein
MTDLDNSTIRRAYLHHNGTAIDLGTLPGDSASEASGVSEDGTVCGTSWNPSLRAFMWKDGQMSAIPLPLGPLSMALGISNNGLVCGWMGDSPLTAHAFIWNGSAAVDLGVIPGGQSSAAYGISDNGDACGAGVLPLNGGPDLTLHAFLWTGGRMTDLGTLPGLPRSRATAVNIADQVVGDSYNENLVGHAFVWQQGAMHKLNSLINSSLQLNITNATSINNAGQIAAYGHYPDPSGFGQIYVAMRLNPIPPLAGDLNCDWEVNVPDLLAVISAWGPCPPQPPGEPFTKNCHADFNDDGVVNHHDIVAVVLNWTP